MKIHDQIIGSTGDELVASKIDPTAPVTNDTKEMRLDSNAKFD